MAATKLSLYNGALLEIGERQLASLSEDREPRRVLDLVWAEDAVSHCLQMGQWKFAKRTVELAASTSVSPDFGYQKAYVIPSDHVRTTALSADEYQRLPLTDYSTEQNYIFTDVEPIYLSYVSNDASYGGNHSLWPTDFVRVVALYLASRIVWRLTSSEAKEKRIVDKLKSALAEAQNSDAMEGPTTFPPPGRFVRARFGSVRRDRGSHSQLIG